jgi:hypothetical protein
VVVVVRLCGVGRRGQPRSSQGLLVREPVDFVGHENY